jgi:hypothetical protein
VTYNRDDITLARSKIAEQSRSFPASSTTSNSLALSRLGPTQAGSHSSAMISHSGRSRSVSHLSLRGGTGNGGGGTWQKSVVVSGRAGSERGLKLRSEFDDSSSDVGDSLHRDRRHGGHASSSRHASSAGSNSHRSESSASAALAAAMDDPHVLTGSLPVEVLSPELFGVTRTAGRSTSGRSTADDSEEPGSTVAQYQSLAVTTHFDTEFAAAHTGQRAFLESLDLYQSPLDVETWDGWTPLSRAALIGDPALTRTLLIRGANPNVESRLKHTPLT